MRLIPPLLAIALTATPVHGGTIRLLTPLDPDYSEVMHRFPLLEEASLIGMRDQIPHRVHFDRVDPDKLRRFAASLLKPSSGDLGTALKTLPVDPDDSGIAGEFQLLVDGLPVEDSTVRFEVHEDGSATLWNTLVPVHRPTKMLAPDEAGRAALAAGKTAGLSASARAAKVWKTYIVRGERAHPAYRVELGGDEQTREVMIDAESGATIGSPDYASFDSIPSDAHWTQPPWTWNGVDPATGKPIACSLDYQSVKPTTYYSLPEFLLKPAAPQVNLDGPAVRLRDVDLGLTVARWEESWYDFVPWQAWEKVESLIYAEVPAKCGPGFPPPAGAGVLKSISPQVEEQARQLRTALLDLSERFDAWGFDKRPPLVLVPDIRDFRSEACRVHYDVLDRPFRLILCGADEIALAQGKSERIPPVEVFAHEVAHVGLHEIASHSNYKFENGVLTEALADIMSAYVDSRHDIDYWKLADRPAYMQRIRDERCKNWGEECNIAPRPALRDLANPKTMNPLNPAPEVWNGENFDFFNVSPQKNGQVISHMLYRLAEGSPAGARDGNPAYGTYEAYEGIGFQPMIEMVRHTSQGYHWATVSATPARSWVSELKLSAAQQCGVWSREEQLVGKVAWIANLADSDMMENGNMVPGGGDDGLPFTELTFAGQKNAQYRIQIARDESFTDIVLDKTIQSDAQSGNGSLAVDLDDGTDYWWRVRRNDAPIFGSPWLGNDTEGLCWRVPSHFRTATVEDLVPAENQTIQPWSARLSWTGSAVWSGYEYMVDDEESVQGPRYKNVWARRVVDTKTYLDKENPGTPEHPNYAVQVPLPSNRDLCWKVIPFALDANADRIDGDAVEQCFHTGTPATVIKSPVANAEVLAQPLTIDYDPADGSGLHTFGLEVLELAGPSAPAAEGPWSYVDNADSDESNVVKEDENPSDWTHRTRQRMLPVQLEATPYINFDIGKVRLSVTSYSPAIPSDDSGGTYEQIHEKTATVTVDFRPADPVDFLDLHPFVTSPPATDSCSSSTDRRLVVEWNHGIDATADTVEAYELELYNEKCNNIHPVGCYPLLVETDPLFGSTLFKRYTVKHNGNSWQSVEFDRNDLFPLYEEENSATGFLVNLHGVSGPVPGPAGLNITGSFLVDLPVLPGKLEPKLEFVDNGPKSSFHAYAETRKNPLAEWGSRNQYVFPGNHVVLEMYYGDSCDPEKVLTHNRYEPEDSDITLSLDEEVFAEDPNPVVSMRAEMTYGGMACPQLVSKCISVAGVNYTLAPEAVKGLSAAEIDGHLAVTWDAPSDADPESLRYHVAIKAAGDLSQNVLYEHPAPQQFTYGELQHIDGKVGRLQLASLFPVDAGKQLSIRVWVCRAVTYACSKRVPLLHEVGSGNPAVLPMPPELVTLHPDDDGSAGDWDWLDPSIFNYSAITVSWEPPSSGPVPTYYLIGFSSVDDVPGVLPTWIDSLGVAGAEYPGAAAQYATVVAATPDGMAFGNSAWGSYVMPLAITAPAPAPASGTWVTANVWSCVGQVPLPPLKAFGWIIGASTASCTGPAAHSAATP